MIVCVLCCVLKNKKLGHEFSLVIHLLACVSVAVVDDDDDGFVCWVLGACIANDLFEMQNASKLH